MEEASDLPADEDLRQLEVLIEQQRLHITPCTRRVVLLNTGPF